MWSFMLAGELTDQRFKEVENPWPFESWKKRYRNRHGSLFKWKVLSGRASTFASPPARELNLIEMDGLVKLRKGWEKMVLIIFPSYNSEYTFKEKKQTQK